MYRTIVQLLSLHSESSFETLLSLTDLLREYASERAFISDLRDQAHELEAKLRNLTSIFTHTAQNLSDCYKTP